MTGGRRRHEYPTGQIAWEGLSSKTRDAVRHEQYVVQIRERRTISPRLALRRVENRVAFCEGLSARAARRRARQRMARASRRSNR